MTKLTDILEAIEFGYSDKKCKAVKIFVKYYEDDVVHTSSYEICKNQGNSCLPVPGDEIKYFDEYEREYCIGVVVEQEEEGTLYVKTNRNRIFKDPVFLSGVSEWTLIEEKQND